MCNHLWGLSGFPILYLVTRLFCSLCSCEGTSLCYEWSILRSSGGAESCDGWFTLCSCGGASSCGDGSSLYSIAGALICWGRSTIYFGVFFFGCGSASCCSLSTLFSLGETMASGLTRPFSDLEKHRIWDERGRQATVC